MLALVPLEARREKFTFRACEIRDSGEYINIKFMSNQFQGSETSLTEPFNIFFAPIFYLLLSSSGST